MELGIVSLLPIVVMFVLIFTTKRTLLALTAASLVGAMLIGGLSFPAVWLEKVQAAFAEPVSEATLRETGLELLQFKTKGSVIEVLARASEEEIRDKFQSLNPLLLDILPLSLEEVFIYELSLKSYAISELLR